MPHSILEKIRTYIKQNAPSTLTHAQNVSVLTAKLSRNYGVNEEKALVAGLMHDIFRLWSEEQVECEVKKHKELLKEFISINASYLIFHGPLASIQIPQLFDFNDEDVLRAIKYHTVISQNPSHLEAALFISDKLEPSKKKKERRDEILKLSEKDLFKALSELVGTIIDYRKKNNLFVHENYYKVLL